MIGSPAPAGADPEAGIEEPAPLLQPYLMVAFSLPFYIDASGKRWLDVLWAKDLIEHTRYIKRMSLAAYAVRRPRPANAVAMDDIPELKSVRCVHLPAPRHLLTALAMLPRTCAILWRELAGTRLVHTAVAGWPLPDAWVLAPLLRWRRRILYINVESAFWRLVPGEKSSLRQRWRAAIHERLNRACIERADISTFTHAGYRRTLLLRGTERGHVVEASWIDEANLVPAQTLADAVERRRKSPAPLKLVFAGRLTQAKGVPLLIEAAAACIRDGIDLQLDLFGEGALAAECAARVRDLGLEDRIRLRGSLPYDQRFFDALRAYDALVIPSITDEQPRIAFDAYSQGLPVIASRTDGHRQCVDEGVTGLMFDAGSVDALKACLARAASDRASLAGMSVAALDRARGLTHRRMHLARWRLLARLFPSMTQAPAQASPP